MELLKLIIKMFGLKLMAWSFNMSDIERGIFITWEMFKDKSTSISEKFILIEISNLSMLEYGCIASNSHFADIMGIKKEAVSRLISSLEKKGYITSKIKAGSRNFSRTITINKMLFDPKQIVISPLTICLETKGNKTNNKTNNKTIMDSFDNLWARYGKVGSKSAAKKIYLSKSFKRTNEEIEKAITRYILTVKDVKYQKHFGTFLNSISDYLEDYEKPEQKQYLGAATQETTNDTIKRALSKFDAIDAEIL